MKKLIGLIALTAILCFVLVPLTYAADAPAAAGSQTVKGDLLKIEGEFYVVKDAAGKELRLHVDKSTAVQGDIKAGDKIEAQTTEKGHVLSIKPAM